VLELVAEGTVRHAASPITVGTRSERARRCWTVAALQYEYSVLARGVEEAILPLALEHGSA